MLSKLKIKNIALIEQLNISLSEGLNVLTGETGAGKSIIIDSVNLVLGERADRDLIRTGTQFASVEAWFCGAGEYVGDILAEQQIEEWDELVLSRELSVSGKNVCRVNGTLTTLSVLKRISDRLVDIHGQHEHQSLLNEKNHMDLLDGFDGRIAEYKKAVANAYENHSETLKRLRSLTGNDDDRQKRIDILKFQIDEITKANIARDEEQELNMQKARLNSSERIMEALNSSYDALYRAEPQNALYSLRESAKRLESISDVDAVFEEMALRINDAYYAIEEVASKIRNEIETNYFDADSLEKIEERLYFIAGLKRKYNDPTINGVYISAAKQELYDLMQSEDIVEQLLRNEAELKAELYNRSVQLSKIRRETAKLFSAVVVGQLSELGMNDADFSVQFDDIDVIENSSFTKNGIDSPRFYISANKGEPKKPLRKVASGGEVSRIMLALKNIAANKGGIPTMIFDEIDSGISGRIAKAVAEKLVNISRKRQVICVTHLAAIASMADCHFAVQKHSDEKATRSNLLKLGHDERIAEIARLAGADTALSLEHAKQMIEQSDLYKSTI